MSDFRIQFEWESPQGAKGPEFRATWARLTILAGKTPVTRVSDKQSRSVRDYVYCPLYPLAEWIATHWWTLRREVRTPRTARNKTYRSRHAIACAREGFALPDLVLTPCGEETLIQWNSSDVPQARVSFLESGSLVAKSADVNEECERFLGSVCSRLDAEGVTGTLLQDEWESIQSCDEEEVAYCEAAAALGLDPFALSDPDRASLVDACASIPRGMSSELLVAIDFGDIRQAISSLNASIALIRGSTIELPSLVGLQGWHPRIDRSTATWNQGYQFARDLRTELGLSSLIPPGLGGIATSINVDPDTLRQAIIAPRVPEYFDAIVGANSNRSPAFVIGKHREDSLRFALSRSLYEYLTAQDLSGSALISAANSDRQKANRAFAAEFLAPADILRQRIGEELLDEEMIDDLAADFGVSSFVIRHQVENHGLAQVA